MILTSLQPLQTGPSDRAFRRFARRWVRPLLAIFLAIIPTRLLILDWNDVPTSSMRPTILPGDRILVDKLAFGIRLPFSDRWIARWRAPAAGDIVIATNPIDGRRIVKRVAGVPGDVVEMRGGLLQINGEPLDYFIEEPAQPRREPRPLGEITELLGGQAHAVALGDAGGSLRDFGPYTLREGDYFLLGDNRDNSLDSRSFGAIPGSAITGRAFAVAFSLDLSDHYLPRRDRFFRGIR